MNMKTILTLIAIASFTQLSPAAHAGRYLDESLDGRLDEIREQNERIIEQLRKEQSDRYYEAMHRGDFRSALDNIGIIE